MFSIRKNHRGLYLMEINKIHNTNRNYWNTNADAWFGTTALPDYGVKFMTEDDLHLFPRAMSQVQECFYPAFGECREGQKPHSLLRIQA